MTIDATSPPTGTVRDWLDERATVAADEISHVFPDDGHISWRELRDAAQRIARHLTGLGLSKGESVALMLPNGRAGITCLFGVLYGGFRATMINLVAGAEAIGYALTHSGSRYVILDMAQRDLFHAACEAKPNRVTPLSPDDLRSAPSDPETELRELCGEDDALLMYTSGTTGLPKGVLHSHISLLAGGWTTALAHRLTPSDRALCVLPIHHINGLCVTVMAPLVSGGSVIVCGKFSTRRFWDLCAQYQATWFSVVPTIISHLLHGESEPNEVTRARIRFGRSASSALAPEVQRAFEGRFGVPIVETMGLTETAAQILSNPLPPGLRKIGSPGMAFGNEVTILSPEFEPLPPDTEGEIAVKGPNVMRGYLDNPQATASAMTKDGWLRTGDLGKIDADGYVFVTGRLKELIIKAGENIAPREVDEALYSHVDVVEAAAFARPCPSYGETVEAAVKLREGAKVTVEQLVNVCRVRLGDFKSPDHIHILGDLPKGPSGKIQRLKLAKMTYPAITG